MSQIQVPKRWIKKDLDEILDVLENGNRPKGGVNKMIDGIPSLGGEHLNDEGGFNFENMKHISEDFYKNLNKGRIEKYDILMVKDGYTGRTSFVDEKFPYQKAAVSEHVFIIRPKKEVIPKFLYYFLRSNFAQLIIKNKTRGIIAGINKQFTKNFSIFFPSDKKIQENIVQKLDYIFGLLDKKKKILSSIQEQQITHMLNLKNSHFHSLLFNGFNGNLTYHWRNTTSESETGKTLLAKIIENRKHKIKKTAKEFNCYEINKTIIELFTIPNTWEWISLGNYAKCQRGKFSIRPRNDPSCYGGIFPFIQIGDLNNNGGWVENHIQTLNEKGLAVSRMFKSGTVVIAIVGATIGNTGLLRYDMCFPDSLIGIESDSLIGNQFIEFYLRFMKKNIRYLAYAGGGQPNIKLPTLNTFPFPLPPLKEQKEIVKQLTKKEEQQQMIISKINSTLKLIESNKKNIDNIKMSIIQFAFSGKLIS